MWARVERETKKKQAQKIQTKRNKTNTNLYMKVARVEGKTDENQTKKKRKKLY